MISPAKFAKPGQADRGEYAESESEPGKRHHFAETAEIIENQRAGALSQFSSQARRASAIESP